MPIVFVSGIGSESVAEQLRTDFPVARVHWDVKLRSQAYGWKRLVALERLESVDAFVFLHDDDDVSLPTRWAAQMELVPETSCTGVCNVHKHYTLRPPPSKWPYAIHPGSDTATLAMHASTFARAVSSMRNTRSRFADVDLWKALDKVTFIPDKHYVVRPLFHLVDLRQLFPHLDW